MMKCLLLFSLLAILLGACQAGSKDKCAVGSRVSDKPVKVRGKKVTCGKDEYCRQAIITAKLKDSNGIQKKYLAYGECVARDDFEDLSCNDGYYCHSIMTKVLQGFVSEPIRAKAFKCAIKCCAGKSFCMGSLKSNLPTPQKYYNIKPEMDDESSRDQTTTFMAPTTSDSSSPEYTTTAAYSSDETTASDYTTASTMDDKTTFEATTKSDHDVTTTSDDDVTTMSASTDNSDDSKDSMSETDSMTEEDEESDSAAQSRHQCMSDSKVSDKPVKVQGESVFCEPDHYCQKALITTKIRDSSGTMKKYLSYSKCVSKDNFEEFSCNDGSNCQMIMTEILQGFVTEQVRAKINRCAIECCPQGGSCLGSLKTDVVASRKSFAVEPEMDDETSHDQTTTFMAPTTSGSSSSDYTTTAAYSSDETTASDYTTASTMDDKTTFEATTKSDDDVTTMSDDVTTTSDDVMTTMSASDDETSDDSDDSKDSMNETDSMTEEDEESDSAANNHGSCPHYVDHLNWHASDKACDEDDTCRKVQIKVVDERTGETYTRESSYCVNWGQCGVVENCKVSEEDLSMKSCKVRCCDFDGCQDYVFSNERESPPEEQLKYSQESIPYLPGCTYNEATNDAWACQTLFFNEFPYMDDAENCRNNLHDVKMCLDRVKTSCLYGEKPTMWDATQQQREIDNWINANQFFDKFNLNSFNSTCGESPESEMDDDQIWQDLTLFEWHELTPEESSVIQPLMRKVYSSKNKFTFCRSLEEIDSLYLAFLKEHHHDEQLRYYDESSRSPQVNYTMTKDKYMIDSYSRKRKIPRCMAIAQREEQASVYEIQPEYFEEQDSDGCWDYNLDVVMGIDGSRSVSEEEFAAMLMLVANITQRFDLKANRFSLMQFAGKKNIRREIEFGQAPTHLEMMEELRNVQQLGNKRVYLNKVFEYAQEDLTKNDVDEDRKCARKILLLITKEKFAERSATIEKAQELLKSGIKIVMVKGENEGGYNQKHYQSLTNGDPESTNYFHQVSNFDNALSPVIEDLHNSLVGIEFA